MEMNRLIEEKDSRIMNLVKLKIEEEDDEKVKPVMVDAEVQCQIFIPTSKISSVKKSETPGNLHAKNSSISVFKELSVGEEKKPNTEEIKSISDE
jgi:hypothetical protein